MTTISNEPSTAVRRTAWRDHSSMCDPRVPSGLNRPDGQPCEDLPTRSARRRGAAQGHRDGAEHGRSRADADDPRAPPSIDHRAVPGTGLDRARQGLLDFYVMVALQASSSADKPTLQPTRQRKVIVL